MTLSLNDPRRDCHGATQSHVLRWAVPLLQGAQHDAIDLPVMGGPLELVLLICSARRRGLCCTHDRTQPTGRARAGCRVN